MGKTKMKNKKDNLVINLAKSRINQAIVGSVAMLLIGIVTLSSFGGGLKVFANNDNNDVTISVNVAAGALSLENLVSDATFSAATAGVTSTESATINNGVVKDYRASITDFKVYMNASNLVGGGSEFVNADQLSVDVGALNLYNIVANYGGDTNTNGSNITLESNSGLFDSTATHSGELGFDNVTLYANIASTLSPDDYEGTVTFTLIGT